MYEFTGKTEQEAIERASEALELDSSQFDVEILESENGLFRKGSVRIRVYPHSEDKQGASQDINEAAKREMNREDDWETPYGEEDSTLEEIAEPNPWQMQIRDFVQELFRRTGQDCKILLYSYSDEDENEEQEESPNGLLLNVENAEDPSQLIGKHGKHLEALQVVLNAYLGRLHDDKENGLPDSLRVHLDIGGYRKRREAKLIKMAETVASQVEKRKTSRLLEEMNPFERRIIHKTLNEWPSISTVSEGDGLYKKVRIIYRGSNH